MNIYDRFFNQMKIQLTVLPHSFKYTVSDYSINGTNTSNLFGQIHSGLEKKHKF